MFAPLLIHGLNQQGALQRAASAKALGLDPAAYGTVYPGSTVTNTTNNTGGGYLKGALLAVVLLAAGGATAAGLLRCLPPRPGAPAPPAATAAPSTRSGAWDVITEEQQPDGTWKQIQRQRLTLPSAKETP
jgi:hypothetical protein